MESQQDKPVEPQPAPVVVKEKTKSRPAVVVLSVLLIAVLVGVGVLGYIAYDQSATLKSADDTISRLTSENVDLKNAQANSEGKNAPSDSSVTLTQREQAELAASQYYCNIKNFGCDKVAGTVTKFQASTATSAGFAIVTAVSGPGLATKLYVKSSTGADWVVIYDGQNTPPQDVVDKFGIPEDFAS